MPYSEAGFVSLQAALKSAWLYRQSKATFFQPVQQNQGNIFEFTPWTGNIHCYNILKLLSVERNEASLQRKIFPSLNS